MANENTTEGPLTATLGEQLAEKGHAPHVRAPAAGDAGAGRAGRSSRVPPWPALARGAVAYLAVAGLVRWLFRRR